jgi:hypothetical protein
VDRTRTPRKASETYGTIQHKMVQPGIGRHQEEREELATNLKGKIVGRMGRVKQIIPVE